MITPGPGDAQGGETGMMSSLGMVNTILRYARVFVLVPAISMIIAGGLALVIGPKFIAESSFKPESQQVPAGGLMGMASQFGFDLSSLTEGESLDYFARLVKSREILTEALRSSYVVEGSDAEARTADLLTIYEIEGETEPQRLWRGVKTLRGDITVGIDHAASVIMVETEAPSAGLAEQLNARLLQLLNEFNLEKRQSGARAEREFVQQQATRASNDLAAAETRLADFLVQNRRYQNSPELIHEADRLTRRVELQQQVYLTLAQSLEQAKLEEVRNTPVFTILDRPEGSAREVGGVIPALVLGLVLGLVLAALWVFTREYVAMQKRRHPEDFRELQQRTRGVRRLWPWSRASRVRPPVGGAPAETEQESAPAYHGS